ncbi:hypothetical protein [Streptomyces acidiscabies]|uniref:Uncharacterized protein n=1 Tax=Streptomyces acidiscabies TaxID=42234 RepID=A0A0L0KCY9_9ACTN|nr:hypothetical protein [Streptomyces acidiscabies]KND35683.1 hypothetical protein IQ63_13975 [Streptomyces acidiscabies]
MSDDVSLPMTVEVHGVFRLHPWVEQVNLEHDLDEDLFSLAIKRAASYGWSSAFIGGMSELGGTRWGHADAGNDWSQDGRSRRVAWLTVYPTVGMARQHLPVLPMTRVMVDALHRMGDVTFTALCSRVPLRLAVDTGFDLRSDADWYALSSPAARTDVAVSVEAGADVDPVRAREGIARRGHGRLRVTPGAEGSAYTVSTPEWTPDAAAWITEVVVDTLRADGVTGEAAITVSAR